MALQRVLALSTSGANLQQLADADRVRAGGAGALSGTGPSAFVIEVVGTETATLSASGFELSSGLNLVSAGGAAEITNFDEWQNNTDMTIDANSASATTITLENAGAGALAISLDGDTTITGNLDVQGTLTTINTTNLAVADRFIEHNAGYVVDTAVTSGDSYIIDPDTTVQSAVDTGGFVAGVAATTDCDVTVVSSASFTVADLVQITGAADADNNGIFEVASIPDGTSLRLSGELTANGEDFTKGDFTTDTTVQGTVTKVSVGVFQFSSSGVAQTAFGATTPLSFNNLATGGGNSLQQAYDVGNAIQLSDGSGDFTIDLDDTATRANFILRDEAGTANYLATDSAGSTLDLGSATYAVESLGAFTASNGMTVSGTSEVFALSATGTHTFTGGDLDIDVPVDTSSTITNSGGEHLFSGGNLQMADSIPLEIGTGADDSIIHNGTDTTWTHATGDLIFDNTLATGSTIIRLGTDTSATDFQVQNNSGTAKFTVTGASASVIFGANAIPTTDRGEELGGSGAGWGEVFVANVADDTTVGLTTSSGWTAIGVDPAGIDNSAASGLDGMLSDLDDAIVAAAASGAFGSAAGTTSLTNEGDITVIGPVTGAPAGKLTIHGDADEVLIHGQGNVTQTSALMILEQSDGTDVFTVANGGLVGILAGTGAGIDGIAAGTLFFGEDIATAGEFFDTAVTATFRGPVTVDETFSTLANTVVGNAALDTLTVNAVLASHFVPDGTTRNLGATGAEFNEVWFNGVEITSSSATDGASGIGYDPSGNSQTSSTNIAGALDDLGSAISGENLFDQTGSNTHQVTITDTFSLGTVSSLGKLTIVGDADEIQQTTRANATQTANLAVWESSAGADYVVITGTGTFQTNGDTDLCSDLTDTISMNGCVDTDIIFCQTPAGGGTYTISPETQTTGIGDSIDLFAAPGAGGFAGGGFFNNGGGGNGAGAGGAWGGGGGAGGADGDGGGTTLTGGAGGATSGAGGAVDVEGGDTTSGTGGAVDISGGDAATGTGGAVDINGGTGSVAGGGINIGTTAGSGDTTIGVGGDDVIFNPDGVRYEDGTDMFFGTDLDWKWAFGVPETALTFESLADKNTWYWGATDGNNSMNIEWTGEDANDNIIFHVTDNELKFDGISAHYEDGDMVLKGDLAGGDTQEYWNGTDLLLTGAVESNYKIGENATNINVEIEGDLTGGTASAHNNGTNAVPWMNVISDAVNGIDASFTDASGVLSTVLAGQATFTGNVDYPGGMGNGTILLVSGTNPPATEWVISAKVISSGAHSLTATYDLANASSVGGLVLAVTTDVDFINIWGGSEDIPALMDAGDDSTVITIEGGITTLGNANYDIQFASGLTPASPGFLGTTAKPWTTLVADKHLITGTSGAAITAGAPVYLDGSGEYIEADASAESTANVVGVCVSGASAGSQSITVAVGGKITVNGSLTAGDEAFLSETTGEVTATAPTTTAAVVKTMGFMVSATVMVLSLQMGIVNA